MNLDVPRSLSKNLQFLVLSDKLGLTWITELTVENRPRRSECKTANRVPSRVHVLDLKPGRWLGSRKRRKGETVRLLFSVSPN